MYYDLYYLLYYLFKKKCENQKSAPKDAFGINHLDDLKWCGREDSNFHGFYPTATSTLRVYQFRHDRTDFSRRFISAKALRVANRILAGKGRLEIN